jgi:hypothetical protein
MNVTMKTHNRVLSLAVVSIINQVLGRMAG